MGGPSSSDSQNDMRYAFFPNAHRVVIKEGGKLTTHDTGDHQTGGVSQPQSSSRSLTFTSQDGPVNIDELKRAD